MVSVFVCRRLTGLEAYLVQNSPRNGRCNSVSKNEAPDARSFGIVPHYGKWAGYRQCFINTEARTVRDGVIELQHEDAALR